MLSASRLPAAKPRPGWGSRRLRPGSTGRSSGSTSCAPAARFPISSKRGGCSSTGPSLRPGCAASPRAPDDWPSRSSRSYCRQPAEDEARGVKRNRVERGIYRQQNGCYGVYVMVAGKPRFKAVGPKLAEARRQRQLLAAKAQSGQLAPPERTTLAELAETWIAGFEAQVVAGERGE